jgi:hypothetical protein
VDNREKWSFRVTARIVCWWLLRRASMTKLPCRPSAVDAAALVALVALVVPATADRLPANRAAQMPDRALALAEDQAALVALVVRAEDQAEVGRRQNH